MQTKQSRRAIITTVALTVLPTTGCLFGSTHPKEAENLSIEVANETTTDQTVTVQLRTSDESVNFEQTEEISPKDAADFQLENPATEYTLTTDVESGPSKSEGWEVNSCTSAINVEIYSDRVDYIYSAC
ncbi:hypothetical protein [Halorussus amylolyticus]|uniref:hypothetical protein n=1 Tax=Halorussus amylolyticus TaxID=1126242 RepID=UPI0010436CA9|nr:hypothetical protein [Halorussus amylolyticus]